MEAGLAGHVWTMEEPVGLLRGVRALRHDAADIAWLCGSAAVGLFFPIAMLISYRLGDTVAGKLFATLCPACMASMALDNANLPAAIFVWLLICVSNAVLYSIPALLFAAIVAFTRRSGSST
jgi:hypothetical protein